MTSDKFVLFEIVFIVFQVSVKLTFLIWQNFALSNSVSLSITFSVTLCFCLLMHSFLKLEFETYSALLLYSLILPITQFQTSKFKFIFANVAFDRSKNVSLSTSPLCFVEFLPFLAFLLWRGSETVRQLVKWVIRSETRELLRKFVMFLEFLVSLKTFYSKELPNALRICCFGYFGYAGFQLSNARDSRVGNFRWQIEFTECQSMQLIQCKNITN